MTAQDLRDRLYASARALNWHCEEVPDFVSPQFRGRKDASAAAIPDIFGIRLGAYPVIVASVTLGSPTDMQEALRPLHSQMVIARSYMSPAELINAHILLCATSTSPMADWLKAHDLAERDETVCRKLIWLPKLKELEASYEDFRNRTFLAAPWEAAKERSDASLDLAQGLAATLLVEAGLTKKVAEDWIEIVNQPEQDPGTMIERLVRACGEAK